MRGISKDGSGGVFVAAFPDAAASRRILHTASVRTTRSIRRCLSA
jgi:hypothetical protein